MRAPRRPTVVRNPPNGLGARPPSAFNPRAERSQLSFHHRQRRRGEPPVTTKVQVTFDCEDPHRMARFWAEALGYEKENHVEFVRELLDAGRIRVDATVNVDGGTQFADVAASRDPEGAGPRLFFERVPKARSRKIEFTSISTWAQIAVKERPNVCRRSAPESSGLATTAGVRLGPWPMSREMSSASIDPRDAKDHSFRGVPGRGLGPVS